MIPYPSTVTQSGTDPTIVTVQFATSPTADQMRLLQEGLQRMNAGQSVAGTWASATARP